MRRRTFHSLVGLAAALGCCVAGAGSKFAPPAPAPVVPAVAVAPAPVPLPAASPAPALTPRPVRPEDTDAAVDKSLEALGVTPPVKPDGPREGDPASLGWQLIQTFLTLGLVLGLVYLVLNVGLRRLMGGSGLSPAGGGMVSVVARVTLEPRRTLYVLKAAGEYLLVSSSEAGVTFLSRLDTAEAERLQSATQAPVPNLSPFLQKLLARRGSPPPEA